MIPPAELIRTLDVAVRLPPRAMLAAAVPMAFVCRLIVPPVMFAPTVMVTVLF